MRRSRESIEADRLREWSSWGVSYFAAYTKCSGCGEVKKCHGRSRGRMKCKECYVKGKK